MHKELQPKTDAIKFLQNNIYWQTNNSEEAITKFNMIYTELKYQQIMIEKSSNYEASLNIKV